MAEEEEYGLRNRLKIVSEWAQLGLGAVFLAASWPKLCFPYEFLSGVYSYGLVGPDTGLYVAAVLPWLEFVTGLSLILQIVADGALLLSASLSAVFVFAQAYALLSGLRISCSCFGSNGGLISYASLSKTLFLLIVSVFVLFFTLQKRAVYRKKDVAKLETNLAASQAGSLSGDDSPP